MSDELDRAVKHITSLPSYQKAKQVAASDVERFVINRIEPDKNAVVVQIMENGKRVVHIECLDNDMLPALQKEARKILGL